MGRGSADDGGSLVARQNSWSEISGPFGLRGTSGSLRIHKSQLVDAYGGNINPLCGYESGVR